MKTSILSRAAILCFLWPMLTGCPAIDVWRPPTPTQEEYDRGLIVLYPGSSNLYIEQLGFYLAMREAGIDLAIEVVPWGEIMEHVFDPTGTQPLFAARAQGEAARLAEYIRSHPGAPVNLMSFSGGAVMVYQVAAALPADVSVDRIIILSAGISSGTDLTGALDRTSQGIVNYWSPREQVVHLIAHVFGLADGQFSHPAASLGFELVDARLTQVEWSPEMASLGNNGEHLDYLFNAPWIQAYVVPWIVTHK